MLAIGYGRERRSLLHFLELQGQGLGIGDDDHVANGGALQVLRVAGGVFLDAAVGDMVVITHTEALALQLEEL